MRHLTAESVLEFASIYDMEIVSFGLAPNPNGFCFERGEATTDHEARVLGELIDRLDRNETDKLRNLVFGK